MIRKLTILFVSVALLSQMGGAKRSTTTLKAAYRLLNAQINWTRENIEFQRVFDALSDDHTFFKYVTTVLPTLKYQRGVNLTAYEVKIRREQAKLNKVIKEKEAYVEAQKVKWKAIRAEMLQLKKNLTVAKRNLLNSTKQIEAQEKKRQLMKELKKLKLKYNLTQDDRDSYEVAYNRARTGIVRMLKKHTRFYMNKTKFFYDFILRKNELSDELFDLRENLTRVDMLINKNIEQETVYPDVRIKDIVNNLTDTINSINTKGYKYKKAKRGMQYLISIMNKYLNKTKAIELERRSKIPDEYVRLNAKVRNLTGQLKVAADDKMRQIQDLLKDKSEEYHDIKYDYYRKTFALRELHMEHFIWEMNLTNYLKERVRHDLVEMMHTPDAAHLMHGDSSIDIRDNVFLDMIDHENYWRSHLRYNRTSTVNYEWQEVLAFEDECKRYMHDNWYSFESLRHKYDRRKRRRRRRHVVRDVKR